MEEQTPQKWYDLAKKLHELILVDIENTSPEILPEVYPKLVIMCQFFRLVRGEAFHFSRPDGISIFQEKIYKMEDDLTKRLSKLEKQLDVNDSKTAYHLELMKKSFDLNHFN